MQTASGSRGALAAYAALIVVITASRVASACTPDVDCPLLPTATVPCSTAVKFNPDTKKPYMDPLPVLSTKLALQCPRACTLISQCRTNVTGAEVTFQCDSLACSSNDTALVLSACKDLKTCSSELIALVAELEKAAQCSCCVEALCGCVPKPATVATLAAIQAQHPESYHNPVQCYGDIPAKPVQAHGLFKGKNVIVFLTDQERATMHFPPDWEQENLPGLTRLKQNGISFNKTNTAACMCAPARATLLTGFFPAQHGVRYVLENDMPPEQYPQVSTPVGLIGLAQVAAAAGMTPVYKGKLHLTAPGGPNNTFLPSDAGKYGWERWNSPDEGANQQLCEGGGNTGPTAWPAEGQDSCGNADARFMEDDGPVELGQEGALAYLTKVAPNRTQPFFLVVSLVNPHDVLFYPSTFNESGYPESILEGPCSVPATVNDSLLFKPKCQAIFNAIVDFSGPMPNLDQKIAYVNWYANLIKKVDGYLVTLLDTLDSLGLTNDTVVIRTADHGELAMAHGGQKQKMFNFYRESLNVPLVFSNPQLWPAPVVSQALVSLVDFVPTMASLLGLNASFAKAAGWAGVDFSQIFAYGDAAAPQDYVAFTFDDFQWGQANPPRVPEPNHIVSVIEDRYKLAKYYTMASLPEKGAIDTITEWEMYDTLTDPLESVNLANVTYHISDEQHATLKRLQAKIAVIEKTRLRSLLLTYPVNMTGALCSGRLGVKGPAFRGSYTGIPTGNGTVAILTDKGLPYSISFYSPIGAITARIANTTTTKAADGTKIWASTAYFHAGTGVYGWFGPAITGTASITISVPSTPTYCPATFTKTYCWASSAKRCAGSFSLAGTAKY